jgi:DNA-3-methyladenine glycosylase II
VASAVARARGLGARVKPTYWDAATVALGRGDPVLRRLMAAAPGAHLARRGDPFTTLARAIVGQQISVKAAQSIWDRFVAATGGGGQPVTLDPARVGRVRMPTLRRAGLSERKANYLRDLARHFAGGALDPRAWPALDDETLIARLTGVKGIGRWTAEMFLIFHELRPDVFPVDDIGLQKAVALHYREGERMAPSELRAFGARWSPYRSVATWYLWRSLDPIPVEY